MATAPRKKAIVREIEQPEKPEIVGKLKNRETPQAALENLYGPLEQAIRDIHAVMAMMGFDHVNLSGVDDNEKHLALLLLEKARLSIAEAIAGSWSGVPLTSEGLKEYSGVEAQQKAEVAHAS